MCVGLILHCVEGGRRGKNITSCVCVCVLKKEEEEEVEEVPRGALYYFYYDDDDFCADKV